MSEQPERWQFDRKVPLALIFTILMQSGFALWWAASINSAVEVAIHEREQLSGRLTGIEDERIDLHERMVRLETKMEDLSDASNEILQILRQSR